MALKKFTKGFTFTPNELLNRPDLSLKAKGLWTYLNSKQDGWNFSVKGTQTQNTDGRDAITNGMKELQEKGYLERVPSKNNQGEFDGYDYHLYDVPQLTVYGKTVNGSSVNGSPVNGKPVTNSNSKTSNTKKSNTLFDDEEIEDLPKTILKYLNDKKPSKIPFKFTKTNRSYIEARLKDDFKKEDFIKVIDFKVRQWKDNAEMKIYIRPETLFGGKFNRYLVEAGEKTGANDGSGNFDFNPSEKAELL